MKPSDKLHQEMIDQIMDCFDFHRVAKAMTAVKWEWANLNRVPDEPELRQEARKLLRQAIKEGLVGTGGFYASFTDGVLRLVFEIDSWSVCPNKAGKIECI